MFVMKLFYVIVFCFCSLFVFTQDISCNVRVVSNQIQISDRSIFNNLQESIDDFLNNTKWTDDVIAPEERLEFSFLINITNRISTDQFVATLQIQSIRPVYNTSYYTTLFNFVDEDFKFKYIDQQVLEYNENTYISNLTSVLAYYVYLMLGLDYSSFEFGGGDKYYLKAKNIVNNSQSSPERGWKAYESDKNRYWIVEYLLDSKYSECKQLMYDYHRKGLDVMFDDVEKGRIAIFDSLEELQKLKRKNPGLFLIQMFFDAKSDEIVNIYSQAFPDEQSKVVILLNDLDPSNSNKYQNITKTNMKE